MVIDDILRRSEYFLYCCNIHSFIACYLSDQTFLCDDQISLSLQSISDSIYASEMCHNFIHSLIRTNEIFKNAHCEWVFLEFRNFRKRPLPVGEKTNADIFCFFLYYTLLLSCLIFFLIFLLYCFLYSLWQSSHLNLFMLLLPTSIHSPQSAH